MFTNCVSGAQDDLKKVTQMAYDQIRSFGMNDTIGMLSFPSESETSFTKPYSKQLQATIDEVCIFEMAGETLPFLFSSQANSNK